FLLASPWANLTITMMLLSLFGLRGLIIIVGALLVAINTGFIYILLEKRGWIEKNKNTLKVKERFSILQDIKRRAKEYKFNLKEDLEGVLSGAWALSGMVLWWIILGIFIASLAGAYIPLHTFHQYMGPTLLGISVTLLLATV
ncbi:MAG: hypothetical protein NC908_03710, partial [Candidatus Omnitrophica bacterium]|nr:hypothetical protein [Candidatus Omnitrophota bacterium]